MKWAEAHFIFFTALCEPPAFMALDTIEFPVAGNLLIVPNFSC